MRRRVGQLGWHGGLALVLALAAWARVMNYRHVLGSGEVVPPFGADGDAAYHLQRTLDAAARFPRVQAFDPWMNWPSGGWCQWTDLYDRAGGGFVLALGGGAGGDRAALLAALFPVVLGVLVVWASAQLVLAVAPRRGARATALAAGLLAALVPDGVTASWLGRTDHHVLEALSVVLLAWWVAAQPRAEAPARRRLAFELLGGAGVALAVHGFSGGTLYVAIAAVALVARALARTPPPVGSGAPALAGGALLSAALTWPAMAQHGRLWSYAWPSLLQPALVAAAALAVAGACWSALFPGGDRPLRRAAWTGGLAALAALLAAPLLWSEVAAGLSGWLMHRDPWLASISEFQPLGAAQGGLRVAIRELGASPGFAFVPALAVLAVAARRRPRLRAVVWFALALATWAVVQLRFVRVMVPLLAAVVALALQQLVLRASTRRPAAARAGVAIAACAVAWCLADPRLRPRLALPDPGREAVMEAALDLRDAPPVRPGARSGALTYWGHGHQVRVFGRRPVVVNGFGTYLDPASFRESTGLLRLDEPALMQLMDRRDLGYLVFGPAVAFLAGEEVGVRPFAGRVLNPEFMGQVPLAPLLIAGSGIPATGVRHLAHLMPRHASEATVPGLGFPLPQLWTYERVEGARLGGTGAPRARVVAELPFREHGRPHVYKAWADVSPDGRWELTLPVPSGLARGSFRTDAVWTVRVGEGPARAVAVGEAAVRGGAAIDADGSSRVVAR